MSPISALLALSLVAVAIEILGRYRRSTRLRQLAMTQALTITMAWILLAAIHIIG